MSFNKMTGTDAMNSYQADKKFSPATLTGKLVFLMLVIGLTACGEGGNPLIGSSVTNNNQNQTAEEPEAVSVSAEVAYFRDTVYNKKDSTGKSVGILRQYCSNCHVRNNVSPAFADANVNTAYGQINGRTASNGQPYADLTTPANSRFVSKVSGGHNCWSSSGTNCAGDAADMLAQIQEWSDLVNGVTTGGGTTTEAPVSLFASLSAPVDADPRVSKTLPANVTDLPGAAQTAYSTLHTIFTTYCSGCHISGSATPRKPYFADADINNSYMALVQNQKIDVNTPNNSRIYLRLAQDSHNCWDVCSANAAEMLTAVTDFANSIVVDAVIDPAMVPSKALELLQGQVVSGGTRYEVGLIAKYNFDEGDGSVAEDNSGIEPQMNLNLNENVGWVGGWGIDIKSGGKASATRANSQKLYDSFVASGEMSVEAWVIPADTNTGTSTAPAPIITYSAGPDNRNFTLGQALYNYTNAVRISNADADGGSGEQLSTPDADEVLQASQQHVVMTYDTVNGRRIYVNGELATPADSGNIGFLDQWDPQYILTLGAETDGTNQWTGKIRLLAFYNNVLTQEQIQQNFDAGVGQKFNLLFKIGHMDDDAGDVMPDLSYIWFTVSEYDDFSYLFTSPQFIVLDPSGTGALTTTLPGTVNIKGIKLGMNGKEADVGQVFANLNTDVTESPQSMIASKSYDFGDGNGTTAVPVIGSGTIVAKQNGPSGSNADQFFLSFEEIAGKGGLSTDPALITFSPDTFPAGSVYVVGLRTFDELNASMAQVTGINPTTIQTTFTNLKQQLPSKEEMAGFLASMQMSIANLAGAYCQALVEDDTKRASYFGVPESFFTTNPGTVDTAFGTGLSANKTAIVNALVTKMVGTSLNIQPNPTAISNALIGSDGNGGLYGSLKTTCATDGCTQDAARVRTVVKGMCMAVLGSAAISEQ